MSVSNAPPIVEHANTILPTPQHQNVYLEGAILEVMKLSPMGLCLVHHALPVTVTLVQLVAQLAWDKSVPQSMASRMTGLVLLVKKVAQNVHSIPMEQKLVSHVHLDIPKMTHQHAKLVLRTAKHAHTIQASVTRNVILTHVRLNLHKMQAIQEWHVLPALITAMHAHTTALALPQNVLLDNVQRAFLIPRLMMTDHVEHVDQTVRVALLMDQENVIPVMITTDLTLTKIAKSVLTNAKHVLLLVKENVTLASVMLHTSLQMIRLAKHVLQIVRNVPKLVNVHLASAMLNLLLLTPLKPALHVPASAQNVL